MRYLIALLIFIGLSFSIEVKRLIILTDYLTPELYQGVMVNEMYLSKKGVICKAYTNRQIRACFKMYKAKEIWYVYLGHSDGNSLGEFLSVKDLTFPKKVDWIIFDACNIGNNPTIYKLLRYVKKGIIASKGKIPYLGLLPLYQKSWQTKEDIKRLISDFYPDRKLKLIILSK